MSIRITAFYLQCIQTYDRIQKPAFSTLTTGSSSVSASDSSEYFVDDRLANLVSHSLISNPISGCNADLREVKSFGKIISCWVSNCLTLWRSFVNLGLEELVTTGKLSLVLYWRRAFSRTYTNGRITRSSCSLEKKKEKNVSFD